MKNRFAPLAAAAALCGLLAGCRPEAASSLAPAVASDETPLRTATSSATERAVRPSPTEPATEVGVRQPPRFTEVAAASGIDFRFHTDAVPGRYFLPEVMGGGVGWLDFDRDGRLDLYATNGCPVVVTPEDEARVSSAPPQRDRLYRQVGGGRFVEVAAAASADETGYGQGIAVGDFDADGFADLHLANYGPDVLLRNNGDGTFSDVTETAGVNDDRWGTSGVWCDFDGDRLLDLYVANYMNVTPATHQVCEYGGKPGYCGPGSYDGVPDRVWRNLGDGTFRAAEEEFGFSTPAGGKGLAVVATDLDEDLVPEVYVANDMEANFLFAREPSGGEGVHYRERAETSGCAFSGDGMNEASMGIACDDFDGDGRPDLFLTHYYHAKNTLYRNLGGLLFDDQSHRSGVVAASYESLGFGVAAGDFDLDGDADLVVANGHVLGPEQQPNEMTPQLLTNDGSGRFVDASWSAGSYFSEKMLGRGLAAADYDGDGDLDVAVSHLDRPLALLRNDTERNSHFVGLRLRTRDRIPPVGGHVRVEAAGHVRTVPIVAGGSYLSSGDEKLLIGLGDAPGPVAVEVRWPTGRVDRWEGLAADTYWELTESVRTPREAPFSAGRRTDEL